MKKALMATLAVAALSLAACGQSVPAGSVGVKVSQYGSNAGVDPTPVGAGWHATGVGETYEIYPTSQKTYPYSKSSNEGSSQNEEIQFADSTGLPLTADVALTVRVDPTKAPALYQKYRMDIDDLIYGPLRMAVRSAVNDEAVKMTSEQIYSGGKTQLLALALTDLQKRYSAEGIEIIGLDWIGNVRFPDSVIQTITLKRRWPTRLRLKLKAPRLLRRLRPMRRLWRSGVQRSARIRRSCKSSGSRSGTVSCRPTWLATATAR
jgi:regulator of protease activity HflC (stomatin/prohibitin superfamily)